MHSAQCLAQNIYSKGTLSVPLHTACLNKTDVPNIITIPECLKFRRRLKLYKLSYVFCTNFENNWLNRK